MLGFELIHASERDPVNVQYRYLKGEMVLMGITDVSFVMTFKYVPQLHQTAVDLKKYASGLRLVFCCGLVRVNLALYFMFTLLAQGQWYYASVPIQKLWKM